MLKRLYNFKEYEVFKQTVFILSLVILLISFLTCPGWASFRGKISKGNKLYHKKKFERALNQYQDAQINNPESPELHFNMGNAFYKKGDSESAYKEYEMATYSKNALFQAKAYYNMGNSLYKQGKLAEAIQLYKKSLQINPDDADAKYNIEFVQKKIKEQMNQKQNQKDDPKKPKNEEKQQKEENKKKDKEKSEEKKEEQQKETNKDEKKDQKDKKPKEEQQKEGEMSKEDALRILNALDDEEKAQKKKKKAAIMKGPSIGMEDW